MSRLKETCSEANASELTIPARIRNENKKSSGLDFPIILISVNLMEF